MLEFLKLAVRSISKRKKRTALTMLGIFVGIAAVVALVSVGEGFQDTINAQFEQVGADKIYIQAREVGFGGENIPGEMTERELNLVKKVQGVSEIAGQLYRSANVQFNDIKRPRLVASLPDGTEDARLVEEASLYEIEDGRMLRARDSMKAMIGNNVAKNKVFGKEIKVGNKLIIEDEEFEVVGILKKVGDPGLDTTIIIPEDDARRVLKDEEAYSYLIAKTAYGVDPDGVADRIERKLRKDRHQKEGKEDFTVQTSTELIESFNVVLNIVQFIFVGIAAISLLVGGIGIMNTMYTAVLERTREIAVMKAIGAKNSEIMKIFLIESGMLGLAGGIIGVLIGVSISKSVEIGVNQAFGAGTLIAAFPIWLIAGTILFSISVGAVSGYLPARRASRLQPADALRYE
ncbi:ABC transporter permease [Candidatus Woesearchaeota archaeon]|nr:ABC transporter permease [Candidatus Woesearchaeota archaeon]